ncbi:MAG: tRNA(Ile)-lysidine synthase [Actinomycetota bacterium]|nr:tRNA(Ile)-lysidine synthase [Actinomycetota bacterium]
MTGPHHAIALTRLAVRRALGQIEEATEGGLVLVACSGGADSLALAASVAFEAPRAGLSAGAVVVDHDLQEGSRATAERAADQCRGLGLDPVEVVTVHVVPAGSPTSAGAGSGPEARARDARYSAFEDVVERVGAVAVLLGHTRDDQAEQVLLGLARGSGTRSLSGMPSRRGLYVRPLLGVARATTVAACEAAGLTAWTDPHNTDPAYGRVRARGLLPLLEAELGPGAVAALARSADLLRQDADALDDLAAQARRQLGQTGKLGQLGDGVPPGQIEAEALRGFPKALRTRVWRLLALEAGCSPGALVSTHLEALDTLVTCWRGQGPIDLPGRVQASRSDGRVLIAATGQVE